MTEEHWLDLVDDLEERMAIMSTHGLGDQAARMACQRMPAKGWAAEDVARAAMRLGVPRAVMVAAWREVAGRSAA